MINTHFLEGKLSKLLLFRILLISSIFSITSIATQLVSEYEYEKKRLWSSTEEIAYSYKDLLNMQVYSFNDSALQKSLDSIVAFESISRARIITKIEGVDNSVKMKSGKHPLDSTVIAFGLVISDGYNNFGNPILLELVADQSIAKDKVLDKLLIIAISQGTKTFVVSLFILFFIQKLVIRHIEHISSWLNTFKAESSFKPMTLPNNNYEDNEMIKLKSIISDMGRNVHEHTVALEEKVAQRTTKLEKQTIELEKAKLELEKLAYTDNLTGIANRASFFQKADEELRRARRLSYEVGIMMLDLDHFKSINDNYGHDAGDEVLQIIATTMADCLRKEDTLGRIGGEEFAIIVPGADKVGMHKLANRLNASIGLQSFSFLNSDEKVTVSIGYTKIKEEELFKSALKRADEHLYTAKNSGRNQFVTDKEFVPSIVS